MSEGAWMSEERYLKPREVASWLGIHVNTVKRLGDSGDIREFRVGKRGDRRYRPEDVNEYLVRRAAQGGRHTDRNARGAAGITDDRVDEAGDVPAEV